MRLTAFNPKTISGQITALIVLSVVIANGFNILAVYLFLLSNRQAPPGERSPMELVTVAQLAAAAKSDAEITAIIKNAQRIGVSISRLRPDRRAPLVVDNASVSNSASASFKHLESARGMEMLQRDLGLGPNGTAILHLSDGSALAFRVPAGHLLPGLIVGPLVYTLAIIVVCVGGLSLYAAHFITLPLSSFAVAAHSVGRNAGNNQPVSEQGPQEIARVARALNEMSARIRELLDERTGMLTAISHDLRTPLTRMKLRAERLSKTALGDVVAEGMFGDIARMEQMLAEALSYLRDARIEPLLSVDLPSVLKTICTESADLGEAVAYEGPERLRYCCKLGAVTRAITNLVDNAIKHGTRVTVGLKQLSDKTVQIDVVDDGPGISYSYRNRVFEPFFKADTARTFESNEGFGLGLSIVRNVVEDHAGTIELLQCVPHGLRVRIVLPALDAKPVIGAVVKAQL